MACRNMQTSDLRDQCPAILHAPTHGQLGNKLGTNLFVRSLRQKPSSKARALSSSAVNTCNCHDRSITSRCSILNDRVDLIESSGAVSGCYWHLHAHSPAFALRRRLQHTQHCCVSTDASQNSLPKGILAGHGLAVKLDGYVDHHLDRDCRPGTHTAALPPISCRPALWYCSVHASLHCQGNAAAMCR